MTAVFETRSRSVVKALSWRVLAGIITTCVVLTMTGKMKFAAEIGLIDTLTKLFIYFFHERIWNKIAYGRLKNPDYEV